MKVTKTKLDGGVNLSIIETDKFKHSYFRMTMLTKLDKKAVSLANLLTRVLMRGTAKHPNIESINKFCDKNYDLTFALDVDGTCDNLIVSYSSNQLQNEFSPEKIDIFGGTLTLMREFLTDPLLIDGKLKEEYVKAEKIRHCDKILSLKNNKSAYAFDRCMEEFLGKISLYGYIDMINEATSDDLLDLLDNLLKTAKIEAVFVGNPTEEVKNQLKTTLNDMFGSRDESKIYHVSKPSPFINKLPYREITEEAEANQSNLLLGYTFSSSFEKIAAKNLFNSLFGRLPTSKLFVNVREKLHLCYSCHSVDIPDSGAMLVTAGISHENLEKVTAETAVQLEAMCHENNITDEEFENAKKQIISSYNSIEDSFFDMANWYNRRNIWGWETDINRLIADLQNVTKEQVCAVAKDAKLAMQYLLKGTKN